MHHWAHKRIKDCDTWWEPETVWHREWKNRFPESYREIFFHDANTNEYHRADIHTPTGVTIEFQNSPLSVAEFNQRNNFYKKLIWVVNGLKFKGEFSFDRQIPCPNDPLLNDFEIAGMAYIKKEDILDLRDSKDCLFQVYGPNHPELKGLRLSDKHYAVSWKNKHKVWFDPRAVVFLDFGHEFLYWLRNREQILEPFWYIQVVKKEDFINKYLEGSEIENN